MSPQERLLQEIKDKWSNMRSRAINRLEAYNEHTARTTGEPAAGEPAAGEPCEGEHEAGDAASEGEARVKAEVDNGGAEKGTGQVSLLCSLNYRTFR